MKGRKLTRLKDHDYSQAGYYFVTFCTKNRVNWLGEIVEGKMILNRNGAIVARQWEWLCEQYPYVQLDEYVVMPNHVHGIMALVDDPNLVGNGRDRSLRGQRVKPLSELMGAFKTTSSKMIHHAGCADFAWQKSFYDHIIRHDVSLHRIRDYIVNNPAQWDTDPDNQNIALRLGGVLSKH